MLLKPGSISGVGVIQFLLAAAFVIWLLFFPASGINFAWPITPTLTAMFIGTSFILRSFYGYRLWREKYWYRLRWIVWGNYAFLGVILLGTFWHVDELNWKSNIFVAHVWILAYILEPLMLPILEPHGEQSRRPVPPELSQGPLMTGLKRTLAATYIVGFAIAGLLVINPAFTSTRWPWPLDPFDARIMVAFPAGCAIWALTMYLSRDWAEVKIGVQGLALYSSALFVVWSINFSRYDPSHPNKYTYGIVVGLLAILLIYYYWRQERAEPAQADSSTEHA